MLPGAVREWSGAERRTDDGIEHLLPLYVTAVAFEESVGRKDMELEGPAANEFVSELRGYFASLPVERFPQVVAHAAALTAGDGEERFEFGLRVMVAGLAAVSASWPAAEGGAPGGGGRVLSVVPAETPSSPARVRRTVGPR